MTAVTGVSATPRNDGGASAESPCGSPEPGLAIVPLGVVPLTPSCFLGLTTGRSNGRAQPRRPRCDPVPFPKVRDHDPQGSQAEGPLPPGCLPRGKLPPKR